MRRLLALVAAALAGLLVAGCGGSGHSAEPPPNVSLLAGDGRVTVTWPAESGVDYWMFYAPSASISTSNWTVIPGSLSVIGAASPFVATGLINGTTYSFTINGRTNGGPGGPGSPSVSAIPRLAGTATPSLPAPWTAGVATGPDDLRGVTFGAVFVAGGANGALFSSADGTTWSAPLNSGSSTNFNAAVFRGVYLAAGDGGAMLYSIDAITWTPRFTGTLNNLNGIATNSGLFVAVGAKGTIVFSGDGITWTAAANSATTNDLFAVTSFGNSLWIAVGANGTLITSTDGSNWTAAVSKTASDLRGVAAGTSTPINATEFVAVGANGTLITSPDAVNWTAQPAIGTNTLSALTFGTQFIAVGANGSIFTSTDGTTWAGQPSTTGGNLNAIVHNPSGYSVVGAAGVNLFAQ